MNGQILVESEIGKGSEFVVRLPQKISNREKLGSKVTESLKNFTYTYDNRRERRRVTREIMPYGSVLIVDDVETNRFVAMGLLKIYRLQIETASSGYEAIEKVKNGNVYDIIFMDHMMPGMDGVEAAKIIRDTGYTAPIVALTANVVSGQAEMFLANGFNDFLAKPIDIRILTSILNRLIRDKQPPEIIEAARKMERQTNRNNINDNTTGTGLPEQQQQKLMLNDMIVPGIDIQRGLNRYEGDAYIYMAILRSYAASVKAILESIKTVDKSSLADYKLGIHSIKGASYDIFADKIGKLAEDLENAAKNDDIDFIDKNSDDFYNETWTLIKEIDSAIKKVESENQKPVKDRPDKELIIKLRNACETYNMDDADAAMAEIESFQYSNDDGLTDWLRKSIDMMGFSQIVEKLSDYI